MGKKHSKKNTKIKYLVIFIIILVAIISGVYIYFNNNKGNNSLDLSNTTENLTSENTANIINNTTENVTNNTATTTQQNVATSSDLFGNNYARAEEIMKTMSIEEKIGQMFLARHPESNADSEIKQYNPGGYLLFGRDFENQTKESVLKELTNNQNSSKIKMFMGVDEEGGTVVRVSEYTAFRSSKFKSPQELWKTGYLQAIINDSVEKSDLLKSIGLNMNLVPVSDVPTQKYSFIYKRSYGRGATKTAAYVSALIKTMNDSKMISTMKHFPGYGDNVDTHTEIAVDERPYSTFENSDFLPFKSGIEAKGPTILVSHNIVKCMDTDNPASLSEKVHKELREKLNFTGIIITDDLAMDAVKKYADNGEAAVKAVQAGNDMIISSDLTKQCQEVIDAYKNGKISEDTINKAVKRILACKITYGII